MRLVKFENEQLPPILNALETENAGQKLVLEVAVRLIPQEIDCKSLTLKQKIATSRRKCCSNHCYGR